MAFNGMGSIDMGLSEREYYRGDEYGRASLGPRSMVINLVIANAVVYGICLLADGADEKLSRMLALRPDLFRSWTNLIYVWQTLTYGFVHSPINKDVFHILFNMFTLWMFGRSVEAHYGRQEFLRFYLAAIVFSGLAWAARQAVVGGSAPVWGASGGVTAVVLLYCFNWPKVQVALFGIIPMPAWILGVLLVGQDLLRNATNPASNVAWDCHLAGAMFAGAYFGLGLRFSSRSGPVSTSPWRRFFRRGPSLRVHAPQEDRDDRLESQADEILEKLHREGEASLTSRERKTLEAYSRRVREKRQ